MTPDSGCFLTAGTTATEAKGGRSPGGCGCWDADLPCWPCYREGVDTPADE